jgi:hypothetical protein
LIAVAFVATLGGFKTARANVPNDEPVLLKATFFSHTNDENKDHDTGVYVQAKTSDGSSLIAHVRIPLKECIDSGGKSAPIPFECAHRFRSKTRRVSPWHETDV